MGKYATYRLRGGGGPAISGLLPPPQPFLEIVEETLLQTSNTANNVGGTSELWASPDGLPPFVFVDTRPWAGTINWGDTGDLDERAYVAAEVGNGTDFLGTSPFSDPVLITHE